MSSSKNSWYSYVLIPGQKILITLILLSVALSAYLGFITPKLIANLYNSFKGGANIDQAIEYLVLLFVGEYFASAIYQISVNKYVQRQLRFVRNKSYKGWILSLESAGKGQFGDHKYPMGEVLSRVLTDTEAVIEMVSTGSFKIFIDLAFIVSCLIGFIQLNTTSGIALIIAEVAVCILLVVGSQQMAKVYMQVRVSTGIMSRVIANLSGGFRFTYFHPHFKFASKKGFNSFEDFLKKQLKANIWDAGYFSMAESLFPILLALLVVIFPYSQILEIAVLAAIIDLIQRSIGPIKEIAGKISSIQRARTGIIRIQEFNDDLATLPETVFEGSSKQLKLKELNIEVDEFTYPKREQDSDFALRDIRLSAKAGELIGIVGQSGCGKSTLLKILATNIITDKASIEFLGTNSESIYLKQDSLESLLDYKSQVGIVSQDSHVFSSSLQFNITLSYEGKDDFDKFWKVIYEKIPYIQHWGIKPEDQCHPKELSLGQKQLICALRSCYLAKPIVLFDEISSALDSELEDALKKLVLMIQEHSLTIIVAHRIETIRNADQIIVMDNGKVVSSGTHANLLKESDHYQKFIEQLGQV